jgi:hypothetical protein
LERPTYPVPAIAIFMSGSPFLQSFYYTTKGAVKKFTAPWVAGLGRVPLKGADK